MKRSKIALGSIAASAIFAGGILVGQTLVSASAPPRVTVGPNYPNLQEAQRAIIQAWNAATLAQKAHADDAQFGSDINMAGRYLNQANDQLEQAAEHGNSLRR
jgi:hypothetical protein